MRMGQKIMNKGPAVQMPPIGSIRTSQPIVSIGVMQRLLCVGGIEFVVGHDERARPKLERHEQEQPEERAQARVRRARLEGARSNRRRKVELEVRPASCRRRTSRRRAAACTSRGRGSGGACCCSRRLLCARAKRGSRSTHVRAVCVPVYRSNLLPFYFIVLLRV